MAIRSKELFPVPSNAAENAKLRNVLYIAGGIGSGAALFLGGTAHAHEEAVDSDGAVVIDKNESVWGELSKRGYTPDQIAADLRNHGIEESEWATYRVDIGTVWYVSPEVLAQKTGIAVPVTVVLEQGDTVWQEASQAGVDESSIPELVTWLEDNTDMPPAHRLPVGFTFTIPPQFLPGSIEVVPAGSNNETETPATEQITVPALETTIEVPAQSEAVTEDVVHESEVVVRPENVIPELTDVFSQDPNSIPHTETVPAQPEIVSDPEVQAYRIILDSLYTNNGVLTAEAAAKAYEFVTQLPRHPEGDPEFPYASEFVKLPAPSVEVPYVVHPNTCSEELYALPSSVLSTLMGIATHEWLLMMPENANKRNSVYEFGDFVSGDHRQHGSGQATDHRTRLIDSAPELLPDGYAINSLSPNFDKEFTKSLLILQLLAQAPGGGYLIDHIEYDEPSIIKEVNSALFALGRTDTPMVRVAGHKEHIHRKTNYIGYENQEAEAGPNTTSQCSYEYLTLDQSLIDQVMSRRSSYPTFDAAPAVNEESPTTPEPTETVEEITVSNDYWLLAPDYREQIAASDLTEDKKAFLLSTVESIMNLVNQGIEINPRVALAQAIAESGWGTGKGALEGNNIFSVKASESWIAENPDKVVWIYDDEYDEDGNKKESAFKKYDTIEEAFLDYARLITSSQYYANGVKCRASDEAYLSDLIHELRRDCTIGRLQGEDGVASYATHSQYVEIISNIISSRGLDRLILVNPDEAQRQATKEWMDMYAA